MSQPDYSTLVAQQRAYFLAGNTRPVAWRKAQLEALTPDRRAAEAGCRCG
jgi:hypothetical protein